MELIELRKLRNLGGLEKSKATYIYKLQKLGKLPLHISDAGYAAYSPEEYKKYKSAVKLGRPIEK